MTMSYPLRLTNTPPIEEVNRLCEMVEDLPEYIQEELSELQSYFGSIEELCEHEGRYYLPFRL